MKGMTTVASTLIEDIDDGMGVGANEDGFSCTQESGNNDGIHFKNPEDG